MRLVGYLDFRKKMLGILLLCGIVPVLAVGGISLKARSEALLKKPFGLMESVRTIKSNQIKQYLLNGQHGIEALADRQISPLMHPALMSRSLILNSVPNVSHKEMDTGLNGCRGKANYFYDFSLPCINDAGKRIDSS